MGVFDDENTKKPARHEIGQDLSLLSVEELHERIADLGAEIGRLELEIETKSTSKSVAEAFFKNG